jgi:molybdenum cofactor cytidylyltransferase
MAAQTAAPVVIVLAAGASARLPPDKLVMDVGGMPMIDRTLKSLRASERVTEVVLVLPPGGKERYSWLRSVNTHLLENPDPARGMISSIRVALASAWAKERPFLVLPADVPFVPASAVTRVVVELFARRCKIVVPAYRGLGGHPGAFSADLHDDFFRHGDRDGTREILMRHRADTVRVNLPDPDICFDVDTPEDLAIAHDAGKRWARVEALADEKKARGRA